MPFPFGVSERSDSVTISEITVGAGAEQYLHDFLVSPAAVAQDDGFQQGSPAEVVDMVHVDVGLTTRRT